MQSPNQKRLLLISYNFPPDQAAGALRWEKLSAIAARRGWGVDVFTLDAAELDNPDHSRFDRLPESVRVFGVRTRAPCVERFRDAIFRLYRWLKPMPLASPGALPSKNQRPSFKQSDLQWALWRIHSWRRLLATWIEFAAYGDWARRAPQLAQAQFDPAIHMAVVSCGPPQMAHEGGRLLSVSTGLPLVIDFRDPWSLVDRIPENHGTPLWLHLASIYEKRCVNHATLVVMNNDPARLAMQQHYPKQATRIITVLNGYDDDRLPSVARDECFRIAYTGEVYLARNPRLLFRAAARIAKEFKLAPQDLAIEFMGEIGEIDGDLSLEQIVVDEGVQEFVTLHPPGTRQEAQQLLARSPVLLNLPQKNHLAVPSKIYEYMRFDAWILVMAERDSATELLLRDTAADVVDPIDIEGLTSVLRRRYIEFESGRRPQPIAADRRFSRQAQADYLFSKFERMIPTFVPSSSESDSQ